MPHQWSFKIPKRNQSYPNMSKLQIFVVKIWGKQHSLNVILEMPIWIQWCLFTVSISFMTIDKNEAVLWVCDSLHPVPNLHFATAKKLTPIVFPPFPICSHSPFWPSSRRVIACGGFHPLEGRLDWPITACTHCDRHRLLPKKLVLLLYMDFKIITERYSPSHNVEIKVWNVDVRGSNIRDAV
jgi:hypothetical protein